MRGSLDYSGWSVEALQRLEALRAGQDAAKAFKGRCAAHPLADALEGATDDSRRLSEAPRWRLLARDFGNGHRECVVMRELPNLQDDLDRAIERDCKSPAKRGESEDPEASKRASVRRASRNLRLKAKAASFNALHTLTTRGVVTDRTVMWRLLKQFVRRVRAVLGEYRYAAVLEPQERGALHVHIASHSLPSRVVLGGSRVKSWNVMRAIWRSVVGELGGNFDEAKRTGRWGTKKPIKGAHAIAAYIAGYVAKDFAAVDFDRKRYSTSQGIDVPEPYRATWRAADVGLAELAVLAFAAVGENVVSRWLDAERGILFVASDDTPEAVRWRSEVDRSIHSAR